MLRFSALLGVLAFLVACLALIGYSLWHSDDFQRKYLYPFPHREKVFRYAEENDVDPFLVAGVISAESKFVAGARSHKGAQGLMQMMPETGRWVAGQTDYPEFTPEALYDPEVSIRFGTWYLASLKKEFNDNDILVLAAYNGGRGNVKQWMGEYGWNYDFCDIDRIPYRETKEYVKRVLQARERYRDLYGR